MKKQTKKPARTKISVPFSPNRVLFMVGVTAALAVTLFVAVSQL